MGTGAEGLIIWDGAWIYHLRPLMIGGMRGV